MQPWRCTKLLLRQIVRRVAIMICVCCSHRMPVRLRSKLTRVVIVNVRTRPLWRYHRHRRRGQRNSGGSGRDAGAWGEHLSLMLVRVVRPSRNRTAQTSRSRSSLLLVVKCRTRAHWGRLHFPPPALRLRIGRDSISITVFSH